MYADSKELDRGQICEAEIEKPEVKEAFNDLEQLKSLKDANKPKVVFSPYYETRGMTKMSESTSLLQ